MFLPFALLGNPAGGGEHGSRFESEYDVKSETKNVKGSGG
jgi:hypothetical protein